jgi:hypothetical protein
MRHAVAMACHAGMVRCGREFTGGRAHVSDLFAAAHPHRDFCRVAKAQALRCAGYGWDLAEPVARRVNFMEKFFGSFFQERTAYF